MITASVKAAVLTRALAIQGSWNYETLTGTGFGFAILPALRALYPEPEALDRAVKRHEGPFNSHPYLAPLALGAVIRMEEEGEAPEVIDRFKTAVRGSLGTLGDQLVWTGLRPVCVLVALALALFGVPWWGVVLAFLCLYNAGHGALMVWGFRLGYAHGREVAGRIRHSAVSRLQPALMKAGGFMAGVVIGIVLIAGVPGLGDAGWGWKAVAFGGVAASALWGWNARRVGVAGAISLAMIGLLAGVLT